MIASAAGEWTVGGQEGYDPWPHLGMSEGVNLTWHEVGPMGETDFGTLTISLRRGLTPAQRRSTLAHELVHIERGPVCGPPAAAPGLLEESLVEQTAALRLIPAFVLDELPELVERHGRRAATDFLGVDARMVDTAVEAVRRVRVPAAGDRS